MEMTNEPEVAGTLVKMWQSFQSGNNGAGAILGPPSTERRDELVNGKDQRHMAEFEGRFSRCRNSLYFLAWGALGTAGEAEQAMENCYRKAWRQQRRFTSDGEFGSWMIRLLINEIVLVANRRVPDPSEMNEAAYPEAR
jgi:DNA-directed RNA polymerase specialized sigma24 family protein